jgi:ABC-type multidrug transport system fused ATPase/permease subunit
MDIPGKKRRLFISAIRLIINVLPRKLRVGAVLNLFYIFLNSLVELFGIAFLIPILVVILDEDKIRTNVWLHSLYTGLRFESNIHFVIFLCLIVLVFTGIKNILSLFLLKLQYKFSFSVYKHISLALFRQYYNLGLQQLKLHNSNNIVHDITAATLLFAQNVVNSISGILNESLVFILFITGLLIYEPSVILFITITIIPFILLFFRIMKNRLQYIGEERNAIAVSQNKLLYESFQGYADIEIKNKGNWVFKNFSSLLERMGSMQVKSALYLQLPLKFIEVVIVLALVIIICFGIKMNKSMDSIGVLLGVFAVAAYRLLPGINRLMNYSMTLRNHVYTFEIVEKASPEYSGKYFDNPNMSRERKEMNFRSELKIDKLSFSFDNNIPVLNEITFSILKGETIGIIGRSGSGKTTLLNILLRFYKEKEGSILVDGRPLREEDTASWRNLIGYVPQEVFIFDGSLAENIALGDDLQNADLNLLNEVIEKANLSDLVKSWKDGIHTQIGERGGKLSGGQKQRIGIARALYKGAEVLFFDEATSALDIATEEEITNSIKDLSNRYRQLTIIIIAHRYTTLKYCTRIIELSDGRVTDEISYEDLKSRILNEI